MFYGIGGLLGLILWVYCVLDVIASDQSVIRNLPKLAWVFIVILFPPVGPIAWLLLGRPQSAGFAPGSTERQQHVPRHPPAPQGPSSPPKGPDDNPEFLRNIEAERLRAWEEELRRREEELRRRELGE